MLNTVISGGQVGADLGGMVGALQVGIPHVIARVFPGFKPQGGRKLDAIPGLEIEYMLPPASIKDSYVELLRWRTEANVLGAQGTVVFVQQVLAETKGSALTVRYARRNRKPFLIARLETEATLMPQTVADGDVARMLTAFVKQHRLESLNIAGQRICNEARVAHIVATALAAAIE